ncbi:unnamed protein product [Alopecurus aequalis]
MGSWFSSPAGNFTVPYEACREFMEEIDAMHAQEYATTYLSPSPWNFKRFHQFIRDLAYRALQYYNSLHPGAEFRFTNQRPSSHYTGLWLVYPPTKDMKAACVGFRRDLWYHLNFSARPCRKTDGEEDDRTFFAELRYDNGANNLIVETCTILEIEKPPLGSSCCAMCPDESQILHPAQGFVCGKEEGHEREFFRERCASDDGDAKEFFSQRDMLRLPFLLGGGMPRYRLPDSP